MTFPFKICVLRATGSRCGAFHLKRHIKICVYSTETPHGTTFGEPVVECVFSIFQAMFCGNVCTCAILEWYGEGKLHRVCLRLSGISTPWKIWRINEELKEISSRKLGKMQPSHEKWCRRATQPFRYEWDNSDWEYTYIWQLLFYV